MPSTTEQKILISGQVLHIKIGLTEEERAYPQRIIINTEINLAPYSDRQIGSLEETVCYSKASKLIKAKGEEKEWILVEDLADTCLNQLLESSPKIESVRIEIRKMVVDGCDWTGIEVVKGRS